jgi:outer membrane PBP1 activator LpoA protein
VKKAFSIISCAICLSLAGCQSYGEPSSQTNHLRLGWTQMNPPPANKGQEVAVLLPTDGNLKSASKAVRTGVMAGYYVKTQQTTSPTVRMYSNNDDDITAAYHQASNNNDAWVLGPFNKSAVTALAQQPSLSIPTLALNFTDTPPQSQALYQFALSPQDEAMQAADKAKADGHSHAIVIAPATGWGRGVANAFQQRWQANGGIMVGDMYYTGQASLDPGIKKVLQLLPSDNPKAPLQHRQDVDVIFLVADPIIGRQVKPLLNFYYASDIPVYATSMIYSGQTNPSLDKDLNNIKFCDIPFVLTTNPQIQQATQQMHELLPNASGQNSRLFAFGYDAYQLAPQMSSLGHSPERGYNGLTGTLYLGDNQQILRRLTWAEFTNGVPRVID